MSGRAVRPEEISEGARILIRETGETYVVESITEGLDGINLHLAPTPPTEPTFCGDDASHTAEHVPGRRVGYHPTPPTAPATGTDPREGGRDE